MYVRGEALSSLSEKGKVEEKYQGFHGADETLTQQKSKYISQSPSVQFTHQNPQFVEVTTMS